MPSSSWRWLALLLACLAQPVLSESCQEASCASDATDLLQARVEVSGEDDKSSTRTKKAGQRSGIESFVYINLDSSAERRDKIDTHFASLGVAAHRLPAAHLDANVDGVYTARDRQLLRHAFGGWDCMNAEHACEADDGICCWGLADALEMTLHKNSAGAKYRRARGTAALGNLVSHIIALKQIQEDYDKLGKAAPVVLMEDDVRLHSDWDETVAKAVSLAGDFDVIKLYSVVESGASEAEIATCESHCSSLSSGTSQCIARATVNPCFFWSTGALLVNPSKAGKILKAFETTSKFRASDIHARRIKRFSIDHLINEPADGGMLDLFVMRPSAAFVDAALDNSSTFVAG